MKIILYILSLKVGEVYQLVARVPRCQIKVKSWKGVEGCLRWGLPIPESALIGSTHHPL